jgi:hypothetical protein
MKDNRRSPYNPLESRNSTTRKVMCINSKLQMWFLVQTLKDNRRSPIKFKESHHLENALNNPKLQMWFLVQTMKVNRRSAKFRR